MRKNIQINWKKVLISIMVMAILFMMIKPMVSQFKTTGEDGRICYEKVCIKRTLDNFDNCIDAGTEETTFWGYTHYYVCDGSKVADICLEWGEQITEKETIALGMRCENE